MATLEDVQRIQDMAEGVEDVAKLKAYRQELLGIAANMAQVVLQATDSAVQQHAGEIRDQAEYAAEEIGGRARQLEIDQMDPDYERRKAERAQFEEQRKQKEAEEAKQGMAQLSGLLGGLFGGKGGGGAGAAGGGALGGLGGLFGGGQQQAQSEAPAAEPPAADAPQAQAPPAAASAPQAGGSACSSCGNQLAAGAKFCPECGTPTQRSCKSCGQAIEGSPKFCPNCGTPTA
jgi:RNA polymerase subunit RPABC4/transcription elongation factor Spt4